MPREPRRTDHPKVGHLQQKIGSASGQARTEPMTLQRAIASPESLSKADVLQLQKSIGNRATVRLLTQRRASPDNNTGMPDTLKSGLESLSGEDLSHVRVHYNSPLPAQLQAEAYAQGSNIYLGPGKDHHLPHEGWHVVQQMQGRVQPTMQLGGAHINDDPSLEREAEQMGRAAERHPLS